MYIPEVVENRGSKEQIWGPWPTFFWGIALLVVTIVSQSLGLLAYVYSLGMKDLGAKDLEKLQYDGDVLIYATGFSLIILPLCIFGIVKLKKASVLRAYLCLQLGNIKQGLPYLLILLLFLPISDLLNLSADRPIVPKFMLNAFHSTDFPILLILATVVAAPIYEELFFRGFMLKGWENSGLGKSGAVLLTSLIWAGIHIQYDIVNMGSVFLLGLLLGAARIRTQSLYFTIGLHSLVNFVATLETMIAADML